MLSKLIGKRVVVTVKQNIVYALSSDGVFGAFETKTAGVMAVPFVSGTLTHADSDGIVVEAQMLDDAKTAYFFQMSDVACVAYDVSSKVKLS